MRLTRTLPALSLCLLGDDTGGSGLLPGSVLAGTGAAPLDPQLRPLDDNGGCTQTHALRFDSPAIDREADPLE